MRRGTEHGGTGEYNTTPETRAIWRAAGERKREARGRRLVEEVLRNPTGAGVRQIQKHIDGYRKAALYIGIDPNEVLDRLLPRWREIEALTQQYLENSNANAQT